LVFLVLLLSQVVDSQILDTSDVEMVEVKMYGENPLVILRCVCQQINCVRDAKGAIKEGAPDDIQSVHYGWAMEQDAAGTGLDGGPPKWIVREMMVQGMQAIV
jgi:predicted lipid-binding transport protein (Tim44 family)